MFDTVSKRDVPSLGVIHGADGRPVRWGTEILLEKDGRLSYTEVWGALDFTDGDPANPNNVILLYTGRSHPKADKVSSTLNPNHNNDPGTVNTSGRSRM
ncbi:MAG TPA: hypothetical protein VLE23_16255 [Geminicoccaceae bacterium]|nr:hypothetical protein [Geminicoccaceae bacterium]